MHEQAKEFCSQIARETGDFHGQGLDIGGRDVNGDCRTLWPHLQWVVVDQMPRNTLFPLDSNVTYIETDASTWEPQSVFDLVLCTEVFEHTSEWIKIIETAHKALRVGGLFVITCAGIGRVPHSAIDGAELRQSEYYCNVSAEELGDQLYWRGFVGNPIYNPLSNDTYCRAVKV